MGVQLFASKSRPRAYLRQVQVVRRRLALGLLARLQRVGALDDLGQHVLQVLQRGVEAGRGRGRQRVLGELLLQLLLLDRHRLHSPVSGPFRFTYADRARHEPILIGWNLSMMLLYYMICLKKLYDINIILAAQVPT